MSVTHIRPLSQLLQLMHTRAWHSDADPLSLEVAEWAALLPNIIKSGSAGLVWPKVGGDSERFGAIALALQHAHQDQVEHNRQCELDIALAVARLHDAGIEPVLVKGWSISRMYPAPLVRLAGDIDLIVPHSGFTSAKTVLFAENRDRLSGIDLQDAAQWADSPHPDMFERADTITADGVKVQVPCAEDHLRLLCFHFLRHGARRPLWLCDIGLLLESRPAIFDWSRCLGDDPRQADWVITTLGLAHHLLGARIDNTPTAVQAARLPGWLIPEVLRQWEQADPIPHEVFPELAGNPRGIVTTFQKRWPKPIAATLSTGARFSGFPRLPLQLMAYVRQIAGYGAFRLLPQAVEHARRKRERRQPR